MSIDLNYLKMEQDEIVDMQRAIADRAEKAVDFAFTNLPPEVTGIRFWREYSYDYEGVEVRYRVKGSREWKTAGFLPEHIKKNHRERLELIVFFTDVVTEFHGSVRREILR